MSCSEPDHPCGAGVLDRFSAPTREWFRSSFPGPTPAQAGAWEAISAGDHALVVAPTGSGKTLAAFLWGVDRLLTHEPCPQQPHPGRVLYISPLRALAADVERNLRTPLVGIGHAARRLGLPVREISVAMRSSDTTDRDRRAFARHGADVLITTPESLYLLLTSRARDQLTGVGTVIVDEVHAIAGTKRGAHLAVSLERLDALLPAPAQRVGLSATVRPVAEVGHFLTGAPGPGRGLRIVQPPTDKQWDLQVQVPVPDLAEPGTGEHADTPSIWPHVEERVVDLIAPADPTAPGQRSSLVFTNSRRLAERLTARINEEWAQRLAAASAPDPSGVDPVGPGWPGRVPAELIGASGIAAGAPVTLARAHHGSVSKEQRRLIEDDLKSGRLPTVVATSSLELGIDMGSIDLVVQVESPPSVAAGLQRVGRAGHQVGAVSRGVILPKHRADLLAATVVTDRMRRGRIEAVRLTRNPLDVLAQQVLAMVAVQDRQVDDVYDLVRRAACFQDLGRAVFESVLDLLAGRYPSEAFSGLRPRLVWDRVTGRLSARPGARLLAVTSGGTIADRGLFGVFIAGENDPRAGGRRVGELDEEMVYESRVGDVITLGASSWQILDITHDQVLVAPAPGRPGRLPFWHGDQPARPAELGAAIGAFVRDLAAAPSGAPTVLEGLGLDACARDNLVRYLDEQRTVTGRLPDDRTLLLERFRDELGDWRVVLHSPYGSAVHAPWALAITARLRVELGIDVQAMAADDGIVLRLPDTCDQPAADGTGPGPSVLSAVLCDPDTIWQEVTTELGGSALFAARFRECAGRALLLPRRRPDRRTPLWQQRQRAAQLLSVAKDFPSFPIVLETVRECLQDVYDVPGLVRLLRDIGSGAVTVVEVETDQPSPMARSLLFGYVAQFLYEGDSPLAERRAAALALDPDLLAELLGDSAAARLADLLDPEAVLTTADQLQRLAADRRARSAEEVADLLRTLGPLSPKELRARCTDPGQAEGWAQDLLAQRRVIRVRLRGEPVFAAVEDAARLRDAFGVALPVGLPSVFTEPGPTPLEDLLLRHARTHVPFTAAGVADRFGAGRAVITRALEDLTRGGRLTGGDFIPDALTGVLVPAGDTGRQYCHPDVLRILRRRSLAALRAEVEPVTGPDLARFLVSWQHVGGRLRGVAGVLAAVEQLAGARLPASAVETFVLPARVGDYRPGMLDEVTAAAEVLWCGHARLGRDDGWVSLHPAGSAGLTLPVDLEPAPVTPLHEALARVLHAGGGYFAADLQPRVQDLTGIPHTRAEIEQALWDLAWAGLVSTDTFAPVRALLRSRRGSRPAPARSRYHRPASRLAARAARTGRAGEPPAGPGSRWSWLPDRETDPTVRAAVDVDVLLDRYGVVTRGSVAAEQVPGGFAAAYRVLAAMEETGAVRRGYFVEGLGASQFASSAAVDRLRARSDPGATTPDAADRSTVDPRAVDPALVLAAADPANPYGAALAWPEVGGGHRPGRRAGAMVALVDGRLVGYLERGSRSLLTTSSDTADLAGLAQGLAWLVRAGRVTSVTLRTLDGAAVLGSDHPLIGHLQQVGFVPGPHGLRLRAP